MSNDAKFWAARIAFWTITSFDASLFLKMLNDSIVAGQSVGFMTPMLFVLCVAATVYIAWKYYRLKANRWKSNTTESPAQIEFEALAAYAADEHKRKEAEKAANQNKNTPPTP